MRIGLFGGFTVSQGPDQVRGAIPQAIVARLAVTPGTPVTTDELLADLWSAPTASVVSSLRAHISRLRARGWGDILSNGRHGYRLDVAPDDVDVVRYRQLVDIDRDHPARVERLTEAEALWTGPPLASLRGFPFAARIVPDLDGRRRSAVLELARRRLTAGDAAIASAVLAGYLSEHPPDEEVVRLHAQALSASGRTSEALDIIDAHRDAGDMSDLRAAIVRQEPALTGAGDPDRRRVDRTGIPIPLTRFVGRQGELDAVARGRAQSRLVTLVGPAGVGKTRLAIEAARRVGPEVDDVQRLVDLAAVPGPDQVRGAVADALGAAEHSVEAMARLLGGRRALLLLDNAEHVLGATAALSSALLERCEGLHIVITSREAMRMPGERVIAVEPFVGGAATDAVTLFQQRAADVNGAVSWTEPDLARVSELCERLDGLPLAIELAAARLDILSLDDVIASLEAPTRSAGGRHDSIDDAIAWSMRLTTASERTVLGQLVEFAGSFTLDAVARICAGDDIDAREATAALARRSLVAPLAVEWGERRFRVLDAVRRHVRRSAAEADLDGWRDRRADYLIGLAAQLSARLRTPDVLRAKATFAAWRADLDDALARMIQSGDRASAVALLSSLAWYWYERGLGADAVATIDRVLSLPGETDPDRESAILHAAAFLRAVGPDPLETVRMTHRFAGVADRTAAPQWPALADVMLAYLAAGAGDDDDAEEHLATSRRHADRIPDDAAWARLDVQMIRGDALRLLGRPSQALDVLADAYRTGTSIGHTWVVKGACFVTGKVLTEVGRPADAVAILRTGALRSLESGDVTSAFAAIGATAAAFVRLDRAEAAATVLGAVDTVGARHGYNPAGSDGEYTTQARTAARAALTDVEWDAAYAAGAGMSVRAVMEFLVAAS
ncbi:BTAD domain-containing putative transcriptional regulator [Microbacterium sp. NPDC079995]|uniref:BTAD domain-containing putative transcriptional regulator n=1 Tax=unclassified Microbacterium TaxID=2609290 RepID=UPI00344C1FBD